MAVLDHVAMEISGPLAGVEVLKQVVVEKLEPLAVRMEERVAV